MGVRSSNLFGRAIFPFRSMAHADASARADRRSKLVASVSHFPYSDNRNPIDARSARRSQRDTIVARDDSEQQTWRSIPIAT
jgi:hypothetical protein